MRGVLRATLRKVSAQKALPGDHHFYLTFKTRMPGVQMADHLKDRFPDEMTIVIQHQYWDFEVYDDRFEIILKFSGVPQHLRVPFAAVTRFVDPSVNFGLQFEDGPETKEILEPESGQFGQTGSSASQEPAGTVVSLDAFRRK
ncbi:MAG: stringent starvation protein B [Alphaproteobacteria bacterium]|nr:stringent starvation protein B [Alphaproteobacteria bacterium]